MKNQYAESIEKIAEALRNLGLGNADTQMGAIELLSKEVKEGSERIAQGLHAIAEAISERDV
jgi:hypothetical protein